MVEFELADGITDEEASDLMASELQLQRERYRYYSFLNNIDAQKLEQFSVLLLSPMGSACVRGDASPQGRREI